MVFTVILCIIILMKKILLGYITNILMEAITEIRFNPITQFVHTNLSNSHFLCDK